MKHIKNIITFSLVASLLFVSSSETLAMENNKENILTMIDDNNKRIEKLTNNSKDHQNQLLEKDSLLTYTISQTEGYLESLDLTYFENLTSDINELQGFKEYLNISNNNLDVMLDEANSLLGELNDLTEELMPQTLFVYASSTYPMSAWTNKAWTSTTSGSVRVNGSDRQCTALNVTGGAHSDANNIRWTTTLSGTWGSNANIPCRAKTITVNSVIGSIGNCKFENEKLPTYISLVDSTGTVLKTVSNASVLDISDLSNQEKENCHLEIKLDGQVTATTHYGDDSLPYLRVWNITATY